MMVRIGRRTILGAIAALTLAAPAWAAETKVAVAANFTEPAKEIATAFAKATGHNANLSFGASGAFYTQVTQGAPFEVFLSADSERPAKVEKDGLGVAGSRFTYAVGRLVLYSTQAGLVDAGGKVLSSDRFTKLSIADPTAAPYGAAAVEAMTKMGVYQKVESKLVKGSSLTQAYQFVSTGAAELGFVALSQVIKQPGGSRWVVPARFHKPIAQQAILLKTGASNPAAAAFVKFLKSRQALAIIKSYGYETR